jgi:hypothetical protein
MSICGGVSEASAWIGGRARRSVAGGPRSDPDNRQRSEHIPLAAVYNKEISDHDNFARIGRHQGRIP